MLAFVLLLAVSAVTASPRCFISAPNVFYVGVPEKVSVVVYGTQAPATVQVYLQDYPHRRKTFSQVQADFTKDKPGLLTVKVNPADVPDQGSIDKQYVYLVARCQQLNFHREIKILLSFRNGVILIQTDKPIYTPKQTVNIRVIPLDFNLYPSTRKISIIVKNPQGIRVQQWKNQNTNTGFISKVLDLGDYALKGIWKLETYYDDVTVYKTSTVFEVKEYVLPKFSVEIDGPDYILPTTNKFQFTITARYTYKKPVTGSVNIRVKIVGFKQLPFVITSFNQQLRENSLKFWIRRQDIIRLDPNIWFPEGSRLQVEADVTERSTGITERVVDSIFFTSSPFTIKFTDTARYFMPGLQFPIKVVVTNTKNEPQPGMPMRITTKAVKFDGSEVDVSQSLLADKDDAGNRGLTSHNGLAEFVVDVPREVKTLKIKVETHLKNASKHNAVKDYIASTYSSPSNEYLMVRQRKPATVGQNVFCQALISGKNVDRLAYMVIARGQIVHQKVIVRKLGIIKTITFQATAMMSPSARLVAYYMTTNGEVVSDTTTLEITDSLPNKISIKDHKVGITLQPGELYTIQILGEKGTNVGLFGVDQSVYLLRNKNRLTPESVFEKLKELDLGCGFASGKDTTDVFKNSGLSVISNSLKSSARQDFSCQDVLHKRKKRSVDQDAKVRCCHLGNTTDTNNRSCIRRLKELEVTAYENNAQSLHQCHEGFINCCITRFGTKDMGFLARSGIDLGDLANDFLFSDDEVADRAQIRSYFPETWFIEENLIGDVDSSLSCKKYLAQQSCGSASLAATVPDTITTWIVQAIAVSNKSGFGIAKPLHLTVIKELFVTLKMPYSVQRGEQISILVTVFNYKKKNTKVHIYLKGNEEFCSTADPQGKLTKLTKNLLEVDGNGGTVSLPITIVPIKYGHILINVYTSNGVDDDAVERKLLVVPEGVEKEKTQKFVLDPLGVLGDAKRNGEGLDNSIKNSTFSHERYFRRSENKQFDSIRIEIPKKSIPESISAMISFTGNMIGPVVTNFIINEDLDYKLVLPSPTGCAEQTLSSFTPNIYILRYLSNTKQVTAAIEAKAYRNIQAGYQRELNFRRSDNAFSIWRTMPGSIWLTAFVAKILCESNKFDGVVIDENVMCLAVKWLIQNQRADGAFPETYQVLRHKAGGVYQNGDIGITAFVVTALLECQCNGMVNNAPISRAVTFIENNLVNLNQPYILALTTYALAMADSSQRYKANDKLTQSAIYNPVAVTRHWEASQQTLKIETAAYALLAQLKLNRLSYAGPIVTWLVQQMNSGGGFKSTTDTTVSLQALAKYSERTAGAKLDLKIAIEPSNIPRGFGKPNPLWMTNDNALLQQSVNILPYLTQDGVDFVVTTVGTGVAQMQVNLKYNLASSKEERCDFTINYTINKKASKLNKPQSDAAPRKRKGNKKHRRKGKGKKKRKNNKKNRKNRKDKKNKKNMNKKNKENKKQKIEAPSELVISVCTQYKKPGKTGMSIVDIGIITGYEVDKRSVKKLMKQKNDTIGNYEISQRSIVFYLNYIDSAKPVCVAFKVIRSFDIGVVYPVPIKVYDYYEPDDSCTKYYSLGKSTPEMGSCDGSSCKCTQDKCTMSNPSIKNVKKLAQEMCLQYDFAIKGKVIYLDEDRLWLTCDVKVEEVIQEGSAKKISKGDIIEFWKRGSCLNPNLNKGEVLFIMGRDKAGRYVLDSSAFVKRLGPHSSRKIAELSRRVRGGACDNY